VIPARLPNLDALDVEALKALVVAQHAELLEQQQSNTQQIEHLKLVIEKYRRMIFGSKSENLNGQLEQLELRLEELEITQAATETAEQRSSRRTTTKPRSRPQRKPLPEDLPREEITHAPAHTCCPDCGGGLRKFGEDVSEQLERIPASFKVIRHVRPKFACPDCELLMFSHHTFGEYTDVNEEVVDRVNHRLRAFADREFVSWKGISCPEWFTETRMPVDAWEFTEEGNGAASLLPHGSWLLSANADTQRRAASRGDRTRIRVDDARRCSVEVPGGTVKHALGSTTTPGRSISVVVFWSAAIRSLTIRAIRPYPTPG
jgi:Transposase C of IS166 homeodomain/zinc-finger binding domain of transposase IS66